MPKINSTKNYFVYRHTNKINNKAYIGITCQKPEYRFNNGRGYKKSEHFYAAILKYGWENFEHEILFEQLTFDEAKEKEIELIEQYQTTDPNLGYNMTNGGEGKLKYLTEEERVAAIKASKTRKEIARKHKYHTDEAYHKNKLEQLRASYIRNIKKDSTTWQKELKRGQEKRKVVCSLRQELRSLYETYPQLFSEDDINIAFGFRNAKSYIYNGKTKLQLILDRVKEAVCKIN